MTTYELTTRYHEAVRVLHDLRMQAGFRQPEVVDSVAMRAEARRFARRLRTAPDTAAAEIDLLSDHAGAQSFWAMLTSHWETMELLLLPSAFELMPEPLPFEVLAVTFSSLLETEPPVEGATMVMLEGWAQGTLSAAAGHGNESLSLSPWMGRQQAGAVWNFADVY